MEEFAIHAFERIKDFYGLSKYQEGYPMLEVINDAQELLNGEYRDDYNGIMLNLHGLQCREHVLVTLTHEYIHYMQCPRWMKRYYTMGHDYWTHPYEVEAFSREHELIHLFKDELQDTNKEGNQCLPTT